VPSQCIYYLSSFTEVLDEYYIFYVGRSNSKLYNEAFLCTDTTDRPNDSCNYCIHNVLQTWKYAPHEQVIIHVLKPPIDIAL
jgi:hypothetical protein